MEGLNLLADGELIVIAAPPYPFIEDEIKRVLAIPAQ
jgi:hypothetical protein